MGLMKKPPCAEGALILGNGSSIDRMMPPFWDHVRGMQSAGRLMIVGTNRCLALSSLFTHSIRLDAAVIRDSYHNLFLEPRYANAYHELWRAFDGWRVGPSEDRTTDCDQFVRQVASWQPADCRDANGEMAVMKNSSVVLSAVNWSFLHGAREIALLGVDYCGSFAHMRPPYGGAEIGWRGVYDRPVPGPIEKQFAAALIGVQAAGGSLVNLSDGSELRAVPTA